MSLEYNVTIGTPMTWDELQDFIEWHDKNIGTEHSHEEYWDIDNDDPIETLYVLSVYDITNEELRLIEARERQLPNY